MANKILVVVDMQRDFVTGPLGNAECVNVVEKVVDVINNGEYDKILITMDTHHDNYMQTQEGRKLPVVHCIENTDGWTLDEKVIKALQESDSEQMIFKKETFGSMNLADYISKLAIVQDQDNTIDFCGVCTGICVISNVMVAKVAVPEANIRVIANACACVTPESHRTALDAMKMCQIEVVE